MRKSLRLLASAALFSALSMGVDAQNLGINRNGAAPNTKAILDLDVSGTSGNPYQGMLIPRMTAAQRLAIAGLGVAETGLWVYQTDNITNADATLNAATAHGYWYWDGAVWQRMSASGNGWKLTGNGNTNVANNYLGTPAGSNDDLYVRTTNSLAVNPAIRINANNGFTGFNMAAAPVEMVEVSGGVQVGNTATNTVGAIKHENTLPVPARFHYGNVDGTAAGWQRLENAETRYLNEQYCPIQLQCLGADGQAFTGDPNGGVVAAPPVGYNTPFPTGAGTVQILGHRVQYIFRGTELQAAGLCTGPITKFSFYVLTNDGTGCTPGLNCPDVKVDIRIGNTALTNFGAYVASQATPLPVSWDPAIEGQANAANVGGATGCAPGTATAFLLSTGWLDFTLNAPFNWTGGNVIIDVSWLRNTTVGSSPQVRVETLGYTASKWVRVNAGLNPSHGCTYNDNPLPGNGITGNTMDRPVTRWYGKVQSNGFGTPTTGNYLNYGGGLVLDTNAAPGAISDAAYRGPGTIRAMRAVYDGTTQLSDHVFDSYFDGEVAPEDMHAADDYTYVALPRLKEHLEKDRHLPNMPSRSEWEEHGTRPIGALQTGLWESVETQALYIAQLEQDLTTLEALAFGGVSSAEELDRLVAEVRSSRRLSEKQKLHLTNALRARYTKSSGTK